MSGLGTALTTFLTKTSAPATTPNAPVKTFSAPGRVNLIGEHTDYTGGLVLPIAIPFYTEATITAGENGYRFSSEGFAPERHMKVDDRSGRLGQWSDYPTGVLRELQALGIEPSPFDLRLKSNVPLSAGLSSSASIEVAAAVALLAFSRHSLSGKEIALLCQRAENRYVGSPCGIMDQFIVTAAEQGHALLISTRDLHSEQLPMNAGALAGTRVVIVNSDVKHSVAEGEYGVRRKELERGQEILRARFPGVRDLGDATIEQLQACQNEIDPQAYKRCRHVVTENARVREAREAMLAGDPVKLGKALLAAHASYRDDFEASIPEIDFLVETAVAQPGCYGSRLTGGGFGGCTVNLVASEHADAFTQAVVKAYLERYNIKAPVYVCEAVDGAMRRNGLETANEEVQA